MAEDISVDAVKIGMLGTVAAIAAVERALDLVGSAPVVVDPVMVAESGASLLDDEAVAALRDRLLPRADVVTPNVIEAAVLAGADDGAAAGAPSDASAAIEALARAVRALGPRAVVITGGHAREAVDVFYAGDEVTLIRGERHRLGASHGSGCTHSAALAAHLALGHSPLEAARRAKAIASEAVRDGLRGVGAGAGPVNALGLGVSSSVAPQVDRLGSLT